MRTEADDLRSGSRSRDRLREAMLGLLDERGPESVTITDVVAAAGVTRPTFYAAFGDLPTAFADAALSRLQEAFEGMTLAADLPEGERAAAMEAAFAEILRRMERHAEFFARTLRGPGGMQVHGRVVEFLAERLRHDSPLSPTLASGPLPARAAAAAIAAGMTWTLMTWLDDENRSSTQDLATLLRDLAVHAIVGGLGARTETPSTEELSP